MMIDSRLLLSAAALCAAVSLSAEAKLYKWVDSNGTTHYGETIPPEYANRDAVKLDKGRIQQREDTKEKSGQKQIVRDPAAEKDRVEAERRDNALLNTYSSEKEIDLALNRNLQQVEARIDSYGTLLKSAHENMSALQQEQDRLLKQNRKIPKSLEEDLNEAQQRIDKFQNDLNHSQQELEAVKARYAADKVRYRELKGLPPAEGQ